MSTTLPLGHLWLVWPKYLHRLQALGHTCPPIGPVLLPHRAAISCIIVPAYAHLELSSVHSLALRAITSSLTSFLGLYPLDLGIPTLTLTDCIGKTEQYSGEQEGRRSPVPASRDPLLAPRD